MKDITTILAFYKDKKRITLLAILFVLIMITIFIIDLNTNPYPPQVSFIDNNQLIKGEIYLDDEYLGAMKTTVFSSLPDDFCQKPHKLSLDTEKESFSWDANPSHCRTNYVKFEVSR